MAQTTPRRTRDGDRSSRHPTVRRRAAPAVAPPWRPLAPGRLCGVLAHAPHHDVPPLDPAVLQIDVEGLRSSDGAVRIAVFTSEATFLDTTPHAAVRPIVGRRSAWAVALPPGDVAVAVHHDENGDGEMKTGLFGLPAEPFGFSNGARALFGPPRWRRAKVTLSPSGTTITIRVR